MAGDRCCDRVRARAAERGWCDWVEEWGRAVLRRRCAGDPTSAGALRCRRCAGADAGRAAVDRRSGVAVAVPVAVALG